MEKKTEPRDVLVGSSVSPFNHHFSLFVRPSIKIRRFYTGNMSSHSSVNARTPDAYENAQVPGGPSWMGIDMTICADTVLWPLQEALHSQPTACGEGWYFEDGSVLVRC